MASQPETALMVLTFNTQATKKKSSFLYYVCAVKAFNAIVTTPCNCLNWEKKKKKATNNKSCYLNFFFMIFSVIVVTILSHN